MLTRRDGGDGKAADRYDFNKTPSGQSVGALPGQTDGDERRIRATRSSVSRGGKARATRDPTTGSVYRPSGSFVTRTRRSHLSQTHTFGVAESKLNSGAPSGETLATGGPLSKE